MNRFTIFTIILGISVVTVTADLVVRDYYSRDAQTTVISDEEGEEDEGEVDEPEATETEEQVAPSEPSDIGETISKEEFIPAGSVENSPEVKSSPPKPTVTELVVKNAEFDGEFSEKHFGGKVFQLLDISKIPVENISLFELSRGSVPIASVTEIALRDEIAALQMYTLLQNKTKPYIDLSLNETNAYGDRSFYVNHAKKPEEAFLTVRIGKNIYAFAYVKLYHPQIKKLIQLLTP